jgi:soluble lytic murein transglycosylase-like protein
MRRLILALLGATGLQVAQAQIYASASESPNDLVVLSDSPSALTPLEVVAANSPSRVTVAVAAQALLPADVIDSIAQAHSVPAELVRALIRVESGNNPKALSPKGARGLMQLMPATAARFGVQDAFDPTQNIEGGVRYLKYLLGFFNNRLDLALAAYNAGEYAVVRAGYRVPNYPETLAYVPKVVRLFEQGLARKP